LGVKKRRASRYNKVDQLDAERRGNLKRLPAQMAAARNLRCWFPG